MRHTLGLGMALSLLISATPALAQRAGGSTQACVGDPARPGQTTVAAEVGFSDDAVSFGALFGHNPRRPFAFGFEAGVVNFDRTDRDAAFVGGDVTIEVAQAPLSVCPLFGVTFTSIEDSDLEIWHIPIGVGFGVALVTETGLRFLPFAVPQAIVVHADGDDDSDTEVEGGVELGLTLAGEQVFGTLDVLVTSLERDDPRLGLTVGLIF